MRLTLRSLGFGLLGCIVLQSDLKGSPAAASEYLINAQTVASEVANYSKKSFEDSAAAWEKLLGAKSLEKAMEVQSEYLKSSYEGFIAQSTKLGELYVDLAREAYNPFEGVLAKTTVMKG